MKDENIAKFLRILKNSGSYEKYFNNYCSAHLIPFNLDTYTHWKRWTKYFHDDKLYRLLYGAFSFRQTKEGERYWLNIANKIIYSK